MRPLLSGLWHERDFVRLWSAHTISRFGSEVSLLAIPLTAALCAERQREPDGPPGGD